jgi:hypothetical protein
VLDVLAVFAQNGVEIPHIVLIDVIPEAMGQRNAAGLVIELQCLPGRTGGTSGMRQHPKPALLLNFLFEKGENKCNFMLFFLAQNGTTFRWPFPLPHVFKNGNIHFFSPHFEEDKNRVATLFG